MNLYLHISYVNVDRPSARNVKNHAFINCIIVGNKSIRIRINPTGTIFHLKHKLTNKRHSFQHFYSFMTGDTL